jgi:hypothetical protein
MPEALCVFRVTNESQGWLITSRRFTMFIEVTEIVWDSTKQQRERKRLVNIDKIYSIVKNDRGDGSILYFDGDEMRVTESYGEIRGLIFQTGRVGNYD